MNCWTCLKDKTIKSSSIKELFSLFGKFKKRDRTSGPGLLTANEMKWRCRRGSMVKVPADGFMHAMNWMLRTSLGSSLFRSYLLF